MARRWSHDRRPAPLLKLPSFCGEFRAEWPGEPSVTVRDGQCHLNAEVEPIIAGPACLCDTLPHSPTCPYYLWTQGKYP